MADTDQVPLKIDTRIKSVRLIQEESPHPKAANPEEALAPVKRPDVLDGKTYKLKSPLTQDHALYVTINDYKEPDGSIRLFEIFINSKNMAHFQWVVALTLVITVVFRTTRNVHFLIHELKSVFDPNGGYLRQTGYVPSLVAEIGGIIERHMIDRGMIDKDEHGLMRQINQTLTTQQEKHDQCPKCFAPTLVHESGCMRCLSCGFERCG